MESKASEKIRAIGYIRVSTEDQNLGPVAQRETLEQWASSQGAELVAVFEDHGVSGGAELEKRPGLLEALDALKAEGAQVLLIAKRDRLARDPMIAAMVERLTERAGASVVSAAGEGNGSDPSDVLMRRMIDAFAEYERLIIRARTKAALSVKRARGEKTGGTRPFGYRVLDGEVKTLEADPDEQTAIAIICELRERGLSFRKIAEELNARGVQSTQGRQWFHPTVKRVFLRGAA